MIKNTLIQENRIGRFVIARNVLMNASSDALCQFFGTMVVVRAESDFILDAIAYTAFSSLFPPVPPNIKPPEYYIWISRNAEGEYGFSVEDRTDSWNGMGLSISYAESEKLPLPTEAA